MLWVCKHIEQIGLFDVVQIDIFTFDGILDDALVDMSQIRYGLHPFNDALLFRLFT